MKYNTIEEVLRAMDGIIETTTQDNDRKGYFAALYKHVTVTIAKGIEFGKFEDAARMEKFDVIFANHYLEAYENPDADTTPKCWEFAFDQAPSDEYAILQQIMLGMSAHICYDLAITVAEVAENYEGLKDLKHDYDIVNEALSLCVPLMDCKLDALSPTYDRLSEPFSIEFVNALMLIAREVAWAYAVRMTLIRDESAHQNALLLRMDAATTALEKHIVLHTGPIFTRMNSMEAQMGLSVGDVVNQIASEQDECYAKFLVELEKWGTASSNMNAGQRQATVF
ncbi:MAG TPA: DUF5995 family protein [Pyrinomonadaceae bacterium]|jgi:hypothetical protein